MHGLRILRGRGAARPPGTRRDKPGRWHDGAWPGDGSIGNRGLPAAAMHRAPRHTGIPRVRGVAVHRPLVLDPTEARGRASEGLRFQGLRTERGAAAGLRRTQPGRGGRCSRTLGARPGDGLRGGAWRADNGTHRPGTPLKRLGVGEPVVAPCARKAGTPAADLAWHRGDGGPAPGNPRRRGAGPVFRLHATLDSDGAQRGEDKTKQHPTTCSTGQASWPPTPSCPWLSRQQTTSRTGLRESPVTLWDGKLRQELSRLCEGGPD